MTEVSLQRVVVLRELSFVDVDNVMPGPALTLDLVHRDVGLVEELFGIAPRAGETDTDTGCHVYGHPPQLERRGYGFGESRGDPFDLSSFMEVLAHDDELVPGQPGQGV